MKSFKVQYLDENLSTCPVGKRLLGIDHGKKTLGLALSDAAQTMVTPLKTVFRGKFEADISALEHIIKDYEVGGLIVGWPLEMNGREGPRTQSVRDYMAMLAPRLGLWWAVWDERLSTDTAQRLMIDDMGLSFAKRKQAVDSLAAQTILDDALNYLRTHR